LVCLFDMPFVLHTDSTGYHGRCCKSLSLHTAFLASPATSHTTEISCGLFSHINIYISPTFLLTNCIILAAGYKWNIFRSYCCLWTTDSGRRYLWVFDRAFGSIWLFGGWTWTVWKLDSTVGTRRVFIHWESAKHATKWRCSCCCWRPGPCWMDHYVCSR
jgi:hypothetical protein